MVIMMMIQALQTITEKEQQFQQFVESKQHTNFKEYQKIIMKQDHLRQVFLHHERMERKQQLLEWCQIKQPLELVLHSNILDDSL